MPIVSSYLAKLKEGVFLFLHRRRLRLLSEGSDPDYRNYLNLQLERTLLKKRTSFQKHTFNFIDEIVERFDLAGKEILCVGCRDSKEMDYFLEKGAKRAVGIDLFSENPDILVMDMHSMTFASESFDLVYSSHSLEHALYPEKAFAEFLRVLRKGGGVAVEVPVNYGTQGADLVDFKSLDSFCASLGIDKRFVEFAEELTAKSERNMRSTPILRALISKVQLEK